MKGRRVVATILRRWAPVLALACLPGTAAAQRAAMSDDFPGLTWCEQGQAVSRIRDDVRDPLVRAQLEAHEAVHRAQAMAFSGCEAFLASLTSARRLIDVELPAYCAQWRIAVAQGADSVELRRDYGWRIAAQSGAMENRLQVVQRFAQECPLIATGSPMGGAAPPHAEEAGARAGRGYRGSAGGTGPGAGPHPSRGDPRPGEAPGE